MWNFELYELMANERIAAYRREAALDRLRLDAVKSRRGDGPATVSVAAGSTDRFGARNDVASGRRVLAAAFVGLAAMAALRRRR